MGWGSAIWNKPIPDLVAKKALDPGSANMHRALLNSNSSSFFLIHNTRIVVPGIRLMVYQPYTYVTYAYRTLQHSSDICTNRLAYFFAPCDALLFIKYFQCL
jgi:hypothetical protein